MFDKTLSTKDNGKVNFGAGFKIVLPVIPADKIKRT